MINTVDTMEANVLLEDKSANEDSRDHVSAIEALKDAVDQQGNISVIETAQDLNGKRPLLDQNTSPDKRAKPDIGLGTPLTTLADLTAQSPNSMNPNLHQVQSPYPFPFAAYNPLGALVYAFPQGSMPETDQYQHMVMQQPQAMSPLSPLGYYDRLREIRTSDEESGLMGARPKGRAKSIHFTPSQTAAAYATGQYSGRFVLLEQPNVRQRKSYKNENRCV